jgi:hypothetical protein
MSRHHIHLPPLTFVPPPKPKKVDKRRRRTQIQSSGSIKDIDDALPVENAIGLGPPPSAYDSRSEIDSLTDDSERRPKQPPGLLSQGTLKAMLLIQEKFK